jgi:hypothetical protein
MTDTQTVTPDTNTGQVTYAEMAAKIRAKYPKSTLYKTKPDKELVEAWIQSKPERAIYAKRVKDYNPEGMGKGVPSQVPKFIARGTGDKGIGVGLMNKEQAKDTPVKDYVGGGLAAAGGAIGGIFGKTPGAAIGGIIGQAAQEIAMRPSFMDKDPTAQEQFYRILGEGVKQAALDKVGQKTGDAFFYLLNKIPHAVIKQGIRLLPSDLGGGKVTKYVEDLLTNLIPSAKTMGEFKAGQNKDVIGAAEKLAKGFSRFRGTSEDMGKLIQDTYQSLYKADYKVLSAKAKTMANPKDIYKTAEYQVFVKNFKNELAQQVMKTNKPELIGGLLRSSSSLQETRGMMAMLDERGPKIANAVRTRLMQDVLQKSLTGGIDPVMKGAQKAETIFSGQSFKSELDKIGEEKLKAIYGQDRYDNIMKFTDLIKRVGSGGGNGAGKFLNLVFLISPLRSGFTLASGKKIAVEGLVFNRAAKIMTSTDGVRMSENFIRAGSMGSIKGISAARDELKVYSERADAEYRNEQQQIEDQYYKEHPDELKYKDLNPTSK